MTSFRMTLIRGSLLLNAVLVFYLCLSWITFSPARKVAARIPYAEAHGVWSNPNNLNLNGDDILLRHTLWDENSELPRDNVIHNFKESQDIPSPLEAPRKNVEDSNAGNVDIANSVVLYEEADKKTFPEDSSGKELLSPPDLLQSVVEPRESAERNGVQKEPSKEVQEKEGEYQEAPREVQERAGLTDPPLAVAPLVEEVPDPPLDSLERKMYSDLRDCPTKPVRQFYSQRGEYWILNNYVPAAMTFRCDESITYTTHGDYTFLDNLDPLTSRWQGPVSVSVYAPGTDFQATVDTILYLRNCMAEGVKKYVTFHLFFHVNHVPKEVPTTEKLLQRKTDCDKDPPKWLNVTTYRQAKKLLYPVNVARNTARENAQTYFNFPSDVELYPSINFIPEFFKMLKRPDVSNSTNQRVYVFPIFEVSENQNPPETKGELQAMLKAKTAIPFHKKICTKCHNQPKSPEWQKATTKPNMSVFFVSKRQQPYNKWEPIYIGTHREPIYDERLSWEGKSDKMTQMYVLCVRDYEFHILDNAFLVHRPGIKELHKEPERDKVVAKQNAIIRKQIQPEYRTLFGARKGCLM